MGGAKLKGAQFEVTYYDVEGQTNAENVDKATVDKIAAKAKTKKTWVFETDEDGFISLTHDKPTSGDSLYYKSDGSATLPIGTVVIREIKPPTGYLNSNENKYWVRTITSDQSNTETVETYDAPDGDTAFKEQVMRGDLNFSKKLSGKSEVGALFGGSA